MKSHKTWSTPVVPEESRSIPCALCGGEAFEVYLSCEGFSYLRCTACHLAQINPQPLKGAVEARYQQEYLAYELANERNFLALQDRSLKDAGFTDIETRFLPQGRSSLLDVGCATGALLESLRNRGWKVRGIEIGLPSADYARQVRNLEVYSLSLAENRFPAETFDVVLASHLIEHLNDPANFVREVYRILRSGGYFLITTPNIAGFQARLFKSRWRSAIFDHLYLFSVKTLSQLLVKNGFRIEKVITWGGLAAGTAPKPIKWIFDRAAKRLGFGDVMLIKSVKTL
ncbi:MAG: class I SAM-dependent methyltransferase [Spirochaetaceae bacterium]|jgi:2-polyprenyl-3-methyl-5-hydroxy-6-metoxy-1,4-benzoquinol methylase|nr:class I SAM-dependent methyltransferase [Spirochaetaceae bacterium]